LMVKVGVPNPPESVLSFIKDYQLTECNLSIRAPSQVGELTLHLTGGNPGAQLFWEELGPEIPMPPLQAVKTASSGRRGTRLTVGFP
jgi:hypothetical protein